MTFQEWCKRRDICANAVESPTLKILHAAYDLLEECQGQTAVMFGGTESVRDRLEAFLNPISEDDDVSLVEQYGSGPDGLGYPEAPVRDQLLALRERVAQLEQMVMGRSA